MGTLHRSCCRDADDTLLAEFEYIMRDNGQRSGVLDTLRDWTPRLFQQDAQPVSFPPTNSWEDAKVKAE